MKDNTKQAFENINFVERYKKLGAAHQAKAEGGVPPDEYPVEKIIEVISKVFCVKAEYYKDDYVFGFQEQINNLRLGVGIKIRYGYVDPSFNVFKDDVLTEVGGPWGYIKKQLGHEEPIYPPTFTSYAELEQILTEAFAIYEDFKKELIKLESSK